MKGAVTVPVSDTFHDLSLDHKPLGCLTGGVTSPKEWNQFQLTPEQVEQYWRNGYISNIPVLTSEQCDKLLEDYKKFLVSVSGEGVKIANRFALYPPACKKVLSTQHCHICHKETDTLNQ